MSNATAKPKSVQQTMRESQPASSPQTSVQQSNTSFSKSSTAMDSVSSGTSKPAFPQSVLHLESFDPKAGVNLSGLNSPPLAVKCVKLFLKPDTPLLAAGRLHLIERWDFMKQKNLSQIFYPFLITSALRTQLHCPQFSLAISQ
jgi:hypothetical protein